MERCFLSTPIGALRGNRSSTSVLRANADRWQGLENHFGEERQQRDGKQNPGPKAHASMAPIGNQRIATATVFVARG